MRHFSYTRDQTAALVAPRWSTHGQAPRGRTRKPRAGALRQSACSTRRRLTGTAMTRSKRAGGTGATVAAPRRCVVLVDASAASAAAAAAFCFCDAARANGCLRALGASPPRVTAGSVAARLRAASGGGVVAATSAAASAMMAAASASVARVLGLMSSSRDASSPQMVEASHLPGVGTLGRGLGVRGGRLSGPSPVHLQAFSGQHPGHLRSISGQSLINLWAISGPSHGPLPASPGLWPAGARMLARLVEHSLRVLVTCLLGRALAQLVAPGWSGVEGIGDFGGGSLARLRRWLGAQWPRLPQTRSVEPPRAARRIHRRRRGTELGRCHGGTGARGLACVLRRSKSSRSTQPSP